VVLVVYLFVCLQQELLSEHHFGGGIEVCVGLLLESMSLIHREDVPYLSVVLPDCLNNLLRFAYRHAGIVRALYTMSTMSTCAHLPSTLSSYLEL